MPTTRRRTKRMDRTLKRNSYYWISGNTSKRSLTLALRVWQVSINRDLSKSWVKISGKKISGIPGGMIKVQIRAEYRYILGVSKDLIDGTVREYLLRAEKFADSFLKPLRQSNALEEEFFSREGR